MKTGGTRFKFILYVVLMVISLFAGGASISYRWKILWVVLFTLLFALFLVLAGYTYMSGQRDSAYDTLRRQKEKDEENTKRRMDYFASMAHEIRTPINAILGYDELILREYNDPALRQYAYNIRSAGNTLLALINDSLDYSRIEAGKIELFIAEYDLATVVEDMISLIRPRALSKGLDLKGYVNKSVPRKLYGDAGRLKQCIANILTNAVKYTQEGEIDFSVDYEPVSNETILLKIAVRDTGIGIRQEDLERLYEPFERIEEANIRSIEGSGLGISIVREILALMDSELKVESIYGEGSNFHFEVRQKIADSKPVGDFEQEYAQSVIDKEHFEISFTAPDARVLVVDGIELNLAIMEGLLNGTGIQVDSALSVETGLELARENVYDIVFMDYKLIQFSGGDAIRKLHGETLEKDANSHNHYRNNLKYYRRSKESGALGDANDSQKTDETNKGKNSATPVIAVASGTGQEIQNGYGKQGVSDYLIRPVVYKELEAMLLKYLPSEKVVKSGNKGPEFDKNINAKAPLLASKEKLQEAYKILAQREQVN
ncbi:ATP-binding response regulator [Butyrivibrio sp. WCE2006]|uniref:ATP-binding response regulator n=1 Tax=Butyrivibrio sp. WCE2006 TaxID=1410611 RepID=UPI0006788285|nr:ATP-binding protein [Butyrivibrio sp. WCE2006]